MPYFSTFPSSPVPGSLEFEAASGLVLDHMPTFVAEANAFAVDIQASQSAASASALASASSAAVASASAGASASSAAVAQAAANFRGGWAGLTGALAVPASVQHNGNLWMLLSSLSNVTTAQPGVSGSWYPIVTVDRADRGGIQPTLDLDFSKQRYRVYDGAVGLREIELADVLSYTGSGRTYCDALGVMRTQATNVPRIEFDPTTGACLGMSCWLMGRSNLFSRSQEFDHVDWGKLGGTVTPDLGAGADGTITGDRLVEDATSNVHYVTRNVSFIAGKTYTVSVYARPISTGSKRWFSIVLASNGFGLNVRATFDLVDGTFVGLNSPLGVTMTKHGDLWRCSVTATATATVSAAVQLRLFNASQDSLQMYQGDGVSGVLLWGAQCEESTAPSPYIPTGASAVTAPSDDANISGSNFAKWFNAKEGTFVAEWVQQAPHMGTGRCVLFASDGGSNNLIRLRYSTSGTTLDSAVIAGSNVQATEGVGGGMLALNNTLRAAFTYSANQCASSFGGAALQIDNGGFTMPVVNQLGIGNAFAGNEGLNGVISRLLYFPRALPGNLQALSA